MQFNDAVCVLHASQKHTPFAAKRTLIFETDVKKHEYFTRL